MELLVRCMQTASLYFRLTYPRLCKTLRYDILYRWSFCQQGCVGLLFFWYGGNSVGGYHTLSCIPSQREKTVTTDKEARGVSKRAVKENQKGKRGQKSLDVWNDSGAFETRSGYRPVRKQLRHLEDFPAFAENTCCGVPE